MNDNFLDKTTFEYFASQAAIALGANSRFSLSKSEVIDWMDNENPPTAEEMNAKIIELEAEYDAQQYSRDRAPAYPSVGDQLDMIYKDNKNSTTTHADAVEAVKAKYPKP